MSNTMKMLALALSLVGVIPAHAVTITQIGALYSGHVIDSTPAVTDSDCFNSTALGSQPYRQIFASTSSLSNAVIGFESFIDSNGAYLNVRGAVSLGAPGSAQSQGTLQYDFSTVAPEVMPFQIFTDQTGESAKWSVMLDFLGGANIYTFTASTMGINNASGFFNVGPGSYRATINFFDSASIDSGIFNSGSTARFFLGSPNIPHVPEGGLPVVLLGIGLGSAALIGRFLRG